jgi:hypothetical protein
MTLRGLSFNMWTTQKGNILRDTMQVYDKQRISNRRPAPSLHT